MDRMIPVLGINFHQNSYQIVISIGVSVWRYQYQFTKAHIMKQGRVINSSSFSWNPNSTVETGSENTRKHSQNRVKSAWMQCSRPASTTGWQLALISHVTRHCGSVGERRNYCRANAAAIEWRDLLWVVCMCKSSFDVGYKWTMQIPKIESVWLSVRGVFFLFFLTIMYKLQSTEDSSNVHGWWYAENSHFSIQQGVDNH